MSLTHMSYYFSNGYKYGCNKKIILDKKRVSFFTLSLNIFPTSELRKKIYPKTVRRLCFLFFGKLRNMCMAAGQRILKDHSL